MKSVRRLEKKAYVLVLPYDEFNFNSTYQSSQQNPVSSSVHLCDGNALQPLLPVHFGNRRRSNFII